MNYLIAALNFPMSRKCRFCLGTKSGYSEVIDQKVLNVIYTNADTFLDTGSYKTANSVQYTFFFNLNALLDSLFSFIAGQKNPYVIPINKIM